MRTSVKDLRGLALGAILTVIAGCGGADLVAEKSPVSVGDDLMTIVVASPLPEETFVPGDEVQFNVEIYDHNKEVAQSHPGKGGHYHLYVNQRETVLFVSDVPSFRFAIPGGTSSGSHVFFLEYHDSDGQSERFTAVIPFRVR